MPITRIEPYIINSSANFTFAEVNATGNLTVAGVSNLGPVGNVIITGGSSGQVLTTNGAGNLSWTTISVSSAGISNGNSNVNIPAANGNINLSVAGNANVLVVTGTGANIAGTLNATGNANVGNLAAAQLLATANVTAPVLVSNVATGTSPLTVTSTTRVSNLNVDYANVSDFSNITALTTGTQYVSFVSGTSGNLAEGANATYVANIANGSLAATTFVGNLSGNVSGTITGVLANGNSNVSIPAANGNVNISSAGNANVLVVTGTGVNVAGSSNTTGNIVGGGNLNISGNAVFGGNLTVNGTLSYINVTDLAVSDPIIQLQTGPNGAAPTSNSGKDVGVALNYFDTAARIAFMGWDVSNAEIAFGSNVTIAGEVVTFSNLANIRSGNAQLGNLVTANFFTGTLTTASQPNITSVGTLSSLAVTGNITSGNANLGNLARANFFQGDGGLLTNVSAGTATNLANGNSNVNIPAANGNINLSASGNANILVVTGTGVNVAGTGNVTGNFSAGNVIVGTGSGGNITGANLITANTANLAVALNVTGLSNLGPVGNVTITGGSSGQYLQTNGSGGLSWATVSVSSASISNGNSNVNIPAANGNVNISAVGNANVLVVTGTGVNVAGTLNVTGNANVGNIGATRGVFTNIAGEGGNISNIQGANVSGAVSSATTAGTVTTAAQPNITSLGTLSSLAVTGNGTFGNVYANAGTIGASLLTGTLTTAAQPNITSLGTLGSLSVTGNVSAGNFIGIFANGNSTITIPAANGNINLNAGGSASPELIVTPTGVNVVGTFQVTGVSNLGPVGNLIITGGSNGQVLTTNGSGNLSWTTVSGGGGGASISNGNSNVNIATANGNVTVSVAGNANVVTFTGTGANITGTSNTTGNLTVGGRSNLGPVSNVVITGGTSSQYLQTDGAGNLSWGTITPMTAVSDTFTGNGVQTTFTLSATPANINLTYVNYNGALLQRGSYSLSGNNIIFSDPPANSSAIEVTTMSGSFGAGVAYSRTNATATASQTTFNVVYVPGYLQVYYNGVLLAPSDYTATNGTTVVLADPATAGDLVEFVAFTTTTPTQAQTVTLNSTNLTSNLAITAGYSAVSVGPISIANGVSVTIASGQKWVIL